MMMMLGDLALAASTAKSKMNSVVSFLIMVAESNASTWKFEQLIWKSIYAHTL
jgi:hypothetical protein